MAERHPGPPYSALSQPTTQDKPMTNTTTKSTPEAPPSPKWFDWNDKEGKRRTCGELDTFLSGIAAEHPRVEYVRWQGLSNDLSPADLLPGTERIVVECRLHWHDCNPSVRIHALDRKGEVVQYLWGIVFETRSRKEFETAHVVAAALTGFLEPSNY